MSEHAPPTQPSARFFLDLEGKKWHVYEIDCTDVPGARGRRCLLFMSDNVVRRVYTYPGHWHSLSDEQLERLSWGT